MADATKKISDSARARLLLVALCAIWGLTWPAMRIALTDIPPFTMRTMSTFLGAATLVLLARLAGQSVKIPPRSLWPYTIAVSFFNIIGFSICVAFAQLAAHTGRVAILVYTMPIWASVLAWFVLGERLTRPRALALLMCCIGMAVLIYPLAGQGIPTGLLLSLCAAISWAIGTVLVKRVKVDIDLFTLAAWQLAVACVVMVVLQVTFDGPEGFASIGWRSWAGLLFSAIMGSAVAYYIWFEIIRSLPATTASLGILSSPVIGVVSSIFLLGEWPTTWDVVGFVVIFAASVCVLMEPQIQTWAARGK